MKYKNDLSIIDCSTTELQKDYKRMTSFLFEDALIQTHTPPLIPLVIKKHNQNVKRVHQSVQSLLTVISFLFKYVIKRK